MSVLSAPYFHDEAAFQQLKSRQKARSDAV